MKSLVRLLFVAILPFVLLGCGLKTISHDQNSAANKAKELLESIIYRADSKEVYKGASEEFKMAVQEADFELYVDTLAYTFLHEDLTINSYEHYGGEELLTVFASSKTGTKKIFFALTFRGSTSQDYILSRFIYDVKEIPKNGIHLTFKEPIKVNPPKALNRSVELPNNDSILIHGVEKIYLKEDRAWVYVLKYFTKINIENTKEINLQAKKILKAYGRDKADSMNFSYILLEASNKNFLENPGIEIDVYRTVFKKSDNAWLQIKKS